MAFSQPPNEKTRSYEDFRVSTRYCNEDDVYGAVGTSNAFLQKLGTLSSAQITTLVNSLIDKADERIRRLIGAPITIRKEGHEFFNNPTLQLGPDREDPYEVYGDYDPADKVQEIYAIYYNEYRLKIPYPKNMDQFTEAEALDGWSATHGIMTADTTDFMCGTASLKTVMASAGSIQYPKTHNLHKRIYPWFYMGFWFKCTDPTAKFTFRIVRSTGSYYYGNFNALNADTWEVVQLNVRRFQFANIGGEGAQPDFNWILTYTEYIEITCDKACTFWIDNFCFNDGVFASYPQGTICWCMPEWYPTGRIQVTYSFDPYAKDVPEALSEAAAKFAGARLLDWMIGQRQQKIAFDEMADTLAESPDRETLENTRRRLELEGYEALESIGFKTHSGIG